MKCPHCDTPIDEHEANRCLDAWVAEAVMGGVEDQNFQEKSQAYWRFTNAEGKHMLVDTKLSFRLPQEWHPSTDIAAAWIIWNHCINQLFSERDRFFAVLEDDLTERNKEHERGWRIAWPHAMMNLSPLVICRAALKAAIHETQIA